MDPVLSRVLQFILYGWPHFTEDAVLKPYWSRRLELSMLDGIVLWGNRVVVPEPSQLPIMDELHQGPLGISHMKTLSRMFVWLPNMDSDVEEAVKKCYLCQSNGVSPPPAPQPPLHPWQWPSQPWTRLHLDMAGPFLGHMFLVLIDEVDGSGTDDIYNFIADHISTS